MTLRYLRTAVCLAFLAFALPAAAASTSALPKVVGETGVAREAGPVALVVPGGGSPCVVGADGCGFPIVSGEPGSPTTAVIDQTDGSTANALTAAIDLGAQRLSRIVMPASWTAAVLTVQASADCSTFADLYDQYGAELTIQAGASRSILLAPGDWLGVRCLKLRSGTSAAPVAQAAARTLTLVTVPR